ncbi:MAG: response regulator transcription factor [Chloroflexota bacterium]|nr:response regulator transcription factor [Chloroflexota bacterium]
MAKTILVVDDAPDFVRLVSKVLSHEGYEVLTAVDGQEALRLLFAHKPDLVLLDILMPRMDGWETCRRIREVSDAPIIMLTGYEKTEEDIARGLNHGADEYLIKPVGNRELLARVRAVLRRAELSPSHERKRDTAYADEYLSVDVGRRMVMVEGERVKLTPTEFRLCAVLLENAGRVLTHRQLLEKVWGWGYVDDLDYVRIYVWHLRKKIEPDPSQPRYVMSEPGVGYYFENAHA